MAEYDFESDCVARKTPWSVSVTFPKGETGTFQGTGALPTQTHEGYARHVAKMPKGMKVKGQPIVVEGLPHTPSRTLIGKGGIVQCRGLYHGKDPHGAEKVKAFEEKLYAEEEGAADHNAENQERSNAAADEAQADKAPPVPEPAKNGKPAKNRLAPA